MLQDPRIGYPSDECLIHIYRSGKLALTRKACSLLGLDDDSRIGFKIDSRPGRNLICIGTRGHLTYGVIRVGNHYRVRSTSLCRFLAESLQGYGTYRIESESPMLSLSGDKYYPIFFRKYERND